VLELGVGQPVLHCTIIGKKQQSFTVMIKAACRIDIPEWDEIAQSSSFAGKLAQHSIRLIEDYVAKGHLLRLPERDLRNVNSGGCR